MASRFWWRVGLPFRGGERRESDVRAYSLVLSTVSRTISFTNQDAYTIYTRRQYIESMIPHLRVEYHISWQTQHIWEYLLNLLSKSTELTNSHTKRATCEALHIQECVKIDRFLLVPSTKVSNPHTKMRRARNSILKSPSKSTLSCSAGSESAGPRRK